MGKGEREVQGQASDEGEQEAGEWWGRARDMRVVEGEVQEKGE